MSATKQDYINNGRHQFKSGTNRPTAASGCRAGTWQHTAILKGWDEAHDEHQERMRSQPGDRKREREELRQEAGTVKVNFRQLPESSDQAAKAHQLNLVMQMKAETSVRRIGRLGDSLRRLDTRWHRLSFAAAKRFAADSF